MEAAAGWLLPPTAPATSVKATGAASETTVTTAEAAVAVVATPAAVARAINRGWSPHGRGVVARPTVIARAIAVAIPSAIAIRIAGARAGTYINAGRAAAE